MVTARCVTIFIICITPAATDAAGTVIASTIVGTVKPGCIATSNAVIAATTDMISGTTLLVLGVVVGVVVIPLVYHVVGVKRVTINASLAA